VLHTFNFFFVSRLLLTNPIRKSRLTQTTSNCCTSLTTKLLLRAKITTGRISLFRYEYLQKFNFYTGLTPNSFQHLIAWLRPYSWTRSQCVTFSTISSIVWTWMRSCVILQLVCRYERTFSGFDFNELTHLQNACSRTPVCNRCSGILMNIFVAKIKQKVVILSCYCGNFE